MKLDKPSSTAMFVANGMYYNIHQNHLQPDIPDDLKSFSKDLVEHFYHINNNLRKRLHLFRVSLMQFFSVKGFYLHFLIRKKCIEKHVRDFIHLGFEQVIVFGAGYDTLCSRLANEYPQVIFIEVDHPATARYKASLFTELKWNRSNCCYIAHDLTREFPFRAKGINTELKTVFTCEGVLMYLLKNQVAQILDSVRRAFPNPGRFVFTFMEESGDGNYMFKNASAFTEWWLRIKNEPFTWGIRVSDVDSFLLQNGWHLLEIYDNKKLRSSFLSPKNQHLPVAIGEDVVIATAN